MSKRYLPDFKQIEMTGECLVTSRRTGAPDETLAYPAAHERVILVVFS